MKLRLDNLVYTVTDPAEIDRLYELGAVPFDEKEPEKEEESMEGSKENVPAEVETGEKEPAEELEAEEETKPKETAKGRGKK